MKCKRCRKQKEKEMEEYSICRDCFGKRFAEERKAEGKK